VVPDPDRTSRTMTEANEPLLEKEKEYIPNDEEYSTQGMSKLLSCFKSGPLATVDELVGYGIMLCFVVYAMLMPCFWVKQFIFVDIIKRKHIPALDLARCANDFAGGLVYILMALVWHTLCHKNEKVHNFWKSSRSWVSSIMAGGFIPRPAAFSMCMLLFVSSNIIAQKIVPGPGSGLEKQGWDGPLGDYDGCRADSLEIATYGGFGPVPKRWFQRLYREKPFGCYEVIKQNIFGIDLGTGAWARAFYDLDTNYTDETQKIRAIPDNFNHPNRDSSWNPINGSDMICAYQCAKYSAISFASLIGSVGGIFCGSAVVVTLSDWFTTKIVGWRLIEKSTEPAQLLKAVTGHQLPENLNDGNAEKSGAELKDAEYQPGGKVFCALQLVLILTLASQIAPRLTVDGYFTVDYYTTFTLFFSLLTACMLRLWDPYTCRAVIYTKDLWLNGRDTFLYFDKGSGKWEAKEVDLYEWFNLSAGERAKRLLAYCRTLNSDQVDESLDPKDKKDNWKPTPIDVMTFSDLTVEQHGYALHDKEDETCERYDRTTTFIRIEGGASGQVLKKSKVDGEVIFSFKISVSEDVEHGAWYCSETGDKAIKNVEKEKSIEVSVPMDKLIEKSPKWTYIRAAFGEQPLQTTVKQEREHRKSQGQSEPQAKAGE